MMAVLYGIVDNSSLWVLPLLVLFFVVFALWIVSLWRRNVSIIDLFWGQFFIITALTTLIARGLDTVPLRGWIMTLLVLLWGGRLTWYLTQRNWGKPEDRRYQDMRTRYGSRWPVYSLFLVFFFQALIAWVMSLPIISVILVNTPQTPLTYLDTIGVGLFFLGFIIEVISDHQMKNFRQHNSNKQGPADKPVMNRGLWRYSRHPNYLGEITIWWGISIIGINVSPWALISGIVITLAIRLLSIPVIEADQCARRPRYANYQKTTNTLLPWFPRSSS